MLSAFAGASALVGGVAAADNGTTDDSKANATVVSTNTTVNDAVEEPGDADWYEVSVDANRTLLVTVYGQETADDGSIEPKDLNVTVYTADGERVETDTTEMLIYGDGKPAAVALPVDESGTYYIEIGAMYGNPEDPDAEPATGPKRYEMNVTAIPQDPYEPNNDEANATTLSDGQTVSASLVGGDKDVYAVELDAGETVTATYDETNVVNDSFWGGYGHDLFVDGPDATSVNTTELDGGERVVFTANESGTYYVTAGLNYDSVEATFFESTDAVQYDFTVDVEGGESDPADGTDDESQPDAGDGETDEETTDGTDGTDGTDDTDETADDDSPTVEDGDC
ncbi:hypothetical protein [Halogranum rubrum]|uniref:hypothetical protein n=1 Tax=Halogranum rubrum TaxID=553466 RepID=UPI000B7E9F1C|nr:hypothetical protein [Halogranum rubrum]